MTDEQYKVMNNKRKLLRINKINDFFLALIGEKEKFAKLLSLIVWHMGKQGTNLNQIAHEVNNSTSLMPSDAISINQKLAQIFSQNEKLLRIIKRMERRLNVSKQQ